MVKRERKESRESVKSVINFLIEGCAQPIRSIRPIRCQAPFSSPKGEGSYQAPFSSPKGEGSCPAAFFSEELESSPLGGS